jgi:uncharacterized protein YjbJ (UPF0337 family)
MVIEGCLAPVPSEDSWRTGAMDWNRIEGNWKQFKGQVREKWGRLTDNDLDVINGRQALAKDEAKKGCRGLVQDTAVDSGTLG